MLTYERLVYALAHGWAAVHTPKDPPNHFFLVPSNAQDARHKWAGEWQPLKVFDMTLYVAHWFDTPVAPLDLTTKQT